MNDPHHHNGPFVDQPRGGLFRRLFRGDREPSPTSQRPSGTPHTHGYDQTSSHPQPRASSQPRPSQTHAPMPSFGERPSMRGPHRRSFPIKTFLFLGLAAVGIGSSVLSTVGGLDSAPSVPKVDIDVPAFTTTTPTVETIEPVPAPTPPAVTRATRATGSEIAEITRVTGSRVSLTDLRGSPMVMYATTPAIRRELAGCAKVKCIVRWERGSGGLMIIKRVLVTPTPRS